MARLEKGRCPECGEVIEVDRDVEVGDHMYCPGCDCELSVLKLHPPKFKALKESDLDELEDEEELGEDMEWDKDEDADPDEDEDR